jgi:hypothetical protein
MPGKESSAAEVSQRKRDRKSGQKQQQFKDQHEEESQSTAASEQPFDSSEASLLSEKSIVRSEN